MPGQPQQGSPPFEITQFLGLVSQSASIGDGVPGGIRMRIFDSSNASTRVMTNVSVGHASSGHDFRSGEFAEDGRIPLLPGWGRTRICKQGAMYDGRPFDGRYSVYLMTSADGEFHTSDYEFLVAVQHNVNDAPIVAVAPFNPEDLSWSIKPAASVPAKLIAATTPAGTGTGQYSANV